MVRMKFIIYKLYTMAAKWPSTNKGGLSTVMEGMILSHESKSHKEESVLNKETQD